MITNRSKISKVTADKIVLFGDSITELSSNPEFGFNLAPALQHEYFRKLQVITHGYGGYNTEHARHVVGPILDAETAGGSKIRLMVIFFGTNDAASNEQQHVQLERFAHNLEDIASEASDRRIPVIIVGPAPIDENSTIDDRSTMRNRTYSDEARKTADKMSHPFIELWHQFLESKGWKEGDPIIGKRGVKTDQNLRDLLTDGVHFSGKAYKIWFDLLIKMIREKLPELKTENLPTILPHHSDVDNKDLPASLWQDVVVKQG